MSNAELLIEEIKALPENYTAEVLDFIGYLKQKAAKKQDEMGDECPICAAHRDPVTGEEQFNAKTAAALRESMAMARGEIPSTLRGFNTFEEMWEDLDRDNPDDDLDDE